MKEERAAWFAAAAEHTPFVAVETKWGSFLVRTKDQNVGASLFARRARAEMKVLHRAVSILGDVAGRTFIDVGANIGTTTIPALAAGFGRVVAVEPEAENVLTLRLNLLLNGVEDQVEVVAAAASDCVGDTPFVVAEGKSGKHYISPRAVPRRPHVTVPTTTLDALDIDPDDVGLLWLDVQGYEGKVLDGAKGLLAARCPVVIEWHPGSIKNQGALREHVDRFGSFVDLRENPPVERAIAEFDDVMAERRMADVLLRHQASGVSRM